MTEARLSAGARSLIGLGVIALVAGAAVFAVKQTTPDQVVAVAPESVYSLAADVIPPEDFGLGHSLLAETTTLQRRETLSGLLDRLGVKSDEGGAALFSLTSKDLLDARRVRAGLPVTIYREGDTLQALAIEPEAGRRLLVKRTDQGTFMAAALDARLSPAPMVVRGTVETSLYQSARALGAADQQVVDFAQVFAYDVDFQREVHPGDTFELVFEVMHDERGQVIKRGNVVYAELNGRAVDKAFYRFTPTDDNQTDYFQANGESATRFLMKTPINGARLSSSFGMRRHPISGFNRLHKGTDFAAPTGTPVYAAGHGTIERANRNGGYGNYVRIRHANGYKTAYAHLSRYGKGIKAGRRVRQGEVIGYVGSTGASTGPHLHYEVYVRDKPVNAMSLKLPTGRKLAETPDMLAAFVEERDRIDAIRAQSASRDPFIVAAAAPSN